MVGRVGIEPTSIELTSHSEKLDFNAGRRVSRRLSATQRVETEIRERDLWCDSGPRHHVAARPGTPSQFQVPVATYRRSIAAISNYTSHFCVVNT
jgi:hypothetical protein